MFDAHDPASSPATANEKDQSRKHQVADVTNMAYLSQDFTHRLQKNNWVGINLIHIYYNYVHQQNA